jgi:hypothetical protein
MYGFTITKPLYLLHIFLLEKMSKEIIVSIKHFLTFGIVKKDS